MKTTNLSRILFAPTVGLLGAMAFAPPAWAANAVALVLVDRSGSMHDKASCADATGGNVAIRRKWECAVLQAQADIARIDAQANGTGQSPVTYYVWAFGTLAFDPKNHQMDWAYDKNANPIADATGEVLKAALTAPMTNTEAIAVLKKLETVGPMSDDAGTPLAGAYCHAVNALVDKRGSGDFDLSVLIESDGIENATPATDLCQGIDSGSGNPYKPTPGNPKVVTVVPDAAKQFIVTANNLLVPSWQSNLLDMAVTGVAHQGATHGAPVPFVDPTTGAPGPFLPGLGNPPVTTEVNFIQEFINQSPTVMSASLGVRTVGVDEAQGSASGVLRSQLSTLSASAASGPSTDADFLGFLSGLARISGGRLMATGSGQPPEPGDVTAPRAIPGDADNNGCVNAADLDLVKQFLNTSVTESTPASFAADVNYNGKIDVNDYLVVKASWGKGCVVPPGPFPTSSPMVLGFDQFVDWSSTQPLSLVSSPRTQGSYALSIGGTGWRSIKSVPFSTAVFSNVTSKLALDVYIPSNPSNPFWLGQVLVFVTCPSANLYNVSIGSFELTGKPIGKYATATFALPSSVKAAILSSHSDFSFGITVNANDAGYQFDNLRFAP